jgi:hypothetical protein
MDIIGIFDIDMLNEYWNQIIRLTNACAINIGIGKNTIKGATQVSGHSLIWTFKRSQVKHKSLDCHYVFWIFHWL